jgi:exopolyphosphatase/guanosine-5'-triphosphate,3'-diphosphate pyrophosphatase
MSDKPRRTPDLLAAVDLGSNSFHLVVGRFSHGQLTIVDRLREAVRLAEAVDEQGRLDGPAVARAMACLERFGERLRALESDNVRVVATHALRKARRKAGFLERGRAALGHPIEIISGSEEARLIYVGVASSTPVEGKRRLVLDIGGGSTELIIGSGRDIDLLESLDMGCVAMGVRFFGDGRLSEKRFRRARLAARLELEPVRSKFLQHGWDQVVGSSGIVRAIAELVAELEGAEAPITLAALERIIERALAAGELERLELPAISADRLAVLPGGLAILAELIDVLALKGLRATEGGLREGLLYDMVGRLTNEDARVRSVRAMARRFHVDAEQGERVAQTALALLAQVRGAWDLEDPQAQLMLRWAAELHEAGLDISHSRYHLHGAYLVENADLPGFGREEQRLLAALIRGHRRKVSLDGVEDLIAPWHIRAEYLVLLLRIAVLLHRGRDGLQCDVRAQPKGRALTLEFPPGWVSAHPLTAADLLQEADWLKAIDFRLRVL